MAVRIDKQFLSLRDINEIKNQCTVQGAPSDYGPAKVVHAYGETQAGLYLPLFYSSARFGHPNADITFPSTEYSFSDEFPFRNKDQQAVFDEAMALLHTHYSVLLSLHCGYGKCLARDTSILMFDGTVKMSQDIIIGDQLMGDDSTPRNVLSVSRGREEMFSVISGYDDTHYTVNKSHVLSLVLGEEAEGGPRGPVIDISVQDYLVESRNKQFWGFKVAVSFQPIYITSDPYTVGFIFTDVNRERDGEADPERPREWTGCGIPHEYKANTEWVRLQVLAGIIDSCGEYHLSDPESYFIIKNKDPDILFIARSLGFWATCEDSIITVSGDIQRIPTRKPENRVKRRGTKDNLEYGITLVPQGVDDYYGFTLDGNGRFLLGDFTVTHNTFLAIKLACELQLKCAVLLHRDILMKQWIDSIQKFTTATVQRVDTDGTLQDADIFLFNIACVPKRYAKDQQAWVTRTLGSYKSIGVLIVDEAHIAGAEEMSKALLYFSPKYVIGLTATPRRLDGMDKILELYFGDYKTTRIVRIAKTPFTVYRLPTGIKPDFKVNAAGGKDWSSVITSLTESDERNDLIVKLVRQFNKACILVLTKRVSHCKMLKEKLKGIATCTVMVGTNKKYDATARVLLSTFSKLGVGFDDARLNMLILACSVKEVEQYAGRLRDKPGTQRIIIDLVDNDSNCLKHWNERRKWYVSRNGIIKHYYKEFPAQEIENPEAESEAPLKRLARYMD